MSRLEQLSKTIKEKALREARAKGSPYSESDIDRELAQAGQARKPDDIPTQDTNLGVKSIDIGLYCIRSFNLPLANSSRGNNHSQIQFLKT